MAAAESASGSSLGPRYAPEDPTLPKPWMGLIDGSTGLQYYWNPETNVTQYERPAAVVSPPVPATLPPPARTENLPASQNLQQQQQQQTGSGSSSLLPVQQQAVPPQGAGQGAPMQYYQPQPMPYHQPGQQSYPQPCYQFPQHQPQMAHHHLMQPQQQIQQQIPTQPQQQIQQQLPTQQQPQQMQPQQIPYPLVQQQQRQQHMMLVPQTQVQQQPPQPQQIAPQAGYSKVDEPMSQHGKQVVVGYASPANPSISMGAQIPQVPVHSMPPSQPQIMGPPSTTVQLQTGASLHQMRRVAEANQRPPQPQVSGGGGGLRATGNQMGGHGTGGSTTPIGLPAGPKEPGDDLHGRTRPDFYAHGPSPREMDELGSHQQPKLSAFPVPQNLQEIRSSSSTHAQNFAPGPAPGYNLPSARPMPNPYIHAASGQQFLNAPHLGPSPEMLGSVDIGRPSSAADVYRRQHEVTAMGENVPPPFMTFEATGFPPEILREMHLAGFLSPTPIQAQTWPIAVQGRDIVAIAKTGSGKTLGYLIPAFLHLRRLRNSPQIGPTVLVLSPTRELATQIQNETMKFGRSSGISCTCLYGGAPKGPQIREIEQGSDIVIATPGRLNDMLEINKIDFRQVSFLVLDEADRMLDMGFEPQIRKIVNEIPPRRQTLMYTATWPKEVRKIAGDLLYNPVQVNIGGVDELAANTSITQYVEVVSPIDKQRRLEQILRSQERGSKIIIFCSTKRQCDQLAHSIGRGFGAIAIHGDKSQADRDWALNQFKTGSKTILVATDVAARGLDIKDIRVVINYDFPTGVEDYVHRIGRTGRAGATGISYTFFSDQDWKYAADLIKVLESTNQRVPPEVREMAERGAPSFPKGRGGFSRWDAGGGPGGRWDSGGGRGMRDDSNGFGGRGGRGDHFGGRGGRNDHFGAPGGRGDHFGGRGDHLGGRGGRGDHFGGRGDHFGGRVDHFGGRGGRGDHFGGRMGRGRGFGGPGGRGRGGPGSHDQYGFMEGRGGRFDSRRPYVDRNRGRSYSRSPERGRPRGYDRSRSRSSRSRSRSRSYSRSPSYSRSRSRSWTRSRSRSRSGSSYDRFDRQQGQSNNRSQRVSGFDILPPSVAENPQPSVATNPVPFVSNNPSPTLISVPQPSGPVVPVASGSVVPQARELSPMSPGVTNSGSYLKSEPVEQVSAADMGSSGFPAVVAELPPPGQFPE